MFHLWGECLCSIFNSTCWYGGNVLQSTFSPETVNHICSSITSYNDVDRTSASFLNSHVYIHCLMFCKKCEIRAEPSKGSYAKEWAQWEQRLRVTLFGNADYLNSIQVTIFHLFTIQDHNGCWMFIHILTCGATTNLRRLHSLQKSFLYTLYVRTPVRTGRLLNYVIQVLHPPLLRVWGEKKVLHPPMLWIKYH
jgi:hypothetical protein